MSQTRYNQCQYPNAAAKLSGKPALTTVDCLVVGAGFSGAVIAERLASAGRRVLVVDRREHIGGNAHDHPDEHGVLVHRYGPHIFHTNSARVWRYLSRFTDWRPYEHKVLAEIEGRLVPVPFNLNSLHALFPAVRAARLEQLLCATFGYGARVPILKLRETRSTELRELADYVYHQVFLGYTTKMWGLPPEDLSPAVTARVPVAVSHDDRYFQDTYQAMPAAGYTALFSRLLDQPGITVRTGVDFFTERHRITARRIIYTGPVDAWFDYRYGPLPYRSLRFEHAHRADCDRHQATGTVNFPDLRPETRTTEFKYLTGQPHSGTSLVTEYPRAEGPPYYPIPHPDCEAVYQRYKQRVTREPKVLFLGRLATYRYYNMDQVIAAALAKSGSL